MKRDHDPVIGWQPEPTKPQPCMPRRLLGNGQTRPPVLRPGADMASTLPSRFGNKLRYPDGREEAL